jgi:hypothetical protein
MDTEKWNIKGMLRGKKNLSAPETNTLHMRKFGIFVTFPNSIGIISLAAYFHMNLSDT